MTDLLLAPHNDDEVLWTTWTLLRHDPLVVVCFASHLQELRGTGITARQRTAETVEALSVLGITRFDQWEYADSLAADAALEILKQPMRELAAEHPDATVWAPAVEDNGHDQHNVVGNLAYTMWPQNQVRPYLTYRRGSGRTVGAEVPFEPDWPALKLQALACYRTQIAEPSTAYWFIDSGLREYVPG